MHAKLGFDFYGLGNVGDDLMLAGFLDVWGGRKPLFGVVSPTQQRILTRRFPEVTWLTSKDPQPHFDLWLGVGDTPVQVLSGLWFLEYLERELLSASASDVPVLFFGIGVEREAVAQRQRYKKVLERVVLISTRDDASRDCLAGEFGVPSNRLTVGEDLAHISLERILGPLYGEPMRPLDLAVNFFSEHAGRRQWWAVHRWLQGRSRNQSVAILANECRLLPGSEAGRYAELAWLLALRQSSESLPLLCPNRWAAGVADLVAHFSTMQTVMSSRFHCLLAAAWAGCQTVALSRSSKIEMLRSQLGLASVGAPFSAICLDAAFGEARSVPLAHLESMSAKAKMATQSLLGQCPA